MQKWNLPTDEIEEELKKLLHNFNDSNKKLKNLQHHWLSRTNS